MAAPTFSPRTRTSTRFSEQRHVKTATPYWRDGKSCHRKHVLLALAIAQRVSFQSADVNDPEITHCPRAPYHEQQVQLA